MSVTAVDRSVFAALERFAVLPAWLSATMEPGRLAASLSRHVPEMADGRLRLLGASPDRLRAKGTEWHAHCRVTVAEPGGSPKEVVLVGRLLPPDEPALDVGRFLAYLHARTRHAGGEAAGVLGDELTGTFLAAYAERSELDGDFAARVSAYRAISLARMALRACRQLKDARTRVALTLLDDTDSWPGRPL